MQVWAFDPKGGMELAAGRPLFARFACDDFDAMADMLDEAVADHARTHRPAARRHPPAHPHRRGPADLIVIDELAALTAYLTDRQLKDRIKAALGVLLTQGRAVGVHVVAASRTRARKSCRSGTCSRPGSALRLTEAGPRRPGPRRRRPRPRRPVRPHPQGPQHAGVGYVVLDGDPAPMRVRFSYLTDADITDLAHQYGRLRVVDGDWTEGGAA